MILTCPDCTTRYLTKTEAIGPNGRTVRCASCSATWYVSAPDPSELVLSLAPDAVSPNVNSRPDVGSQIGTLKAKSFGDSHSDTSQSASDSGSPPYQEADPSDGDFITPGTASRMRDFTDSKVAARRGRVVTLMWLLTIALLALGALIVYVNRETIVNANPKAATLYKIFGVDVAVGGLLIELIHLPPPFGGGKSPPVKISLKNHARPIEMKTGKFPPRHQSPEAFR